MSSSNSNKSPFAWLGLLKWSLAYSDGTRPSNEGVNTPMSKEDIEFLEKVMKDGIIDEGERMKEILRDLTYALEGMLGQTSEEEKKKELTEDDMLDLFDELRDIVEQIDYARAFMSLGGIKFLLGCATTEVNIPKSIRKSALSVLSTMCQNNPPVQLNLLEVGHMPQLIQLFFDYTPMPGDENAGDDSMREKVVQTLSASVRGHSMAEHIFFKNEQGKLMLRLGIGLEAAIDKSQTIPSDQLRKRSIFLLRALLTADEATPEQIHYYKSLVSFVCTHTVNSAWEKDAEIREMGVRMLSRLLSQHMPQEVSSVARNIISEHKTSITSLGVKRIQEIHSLGDSDDKDYAALELEAWEELMIAFSDIEAASSNSEESHLLLK